MSQKTTLTKTDVDFIHYALAEHIAIVKSNHGCPWEASLAEEKKQVEQIKRKLPVGDNLKAPALTKDDFWFLDFALCERSDFVNEGVGTSWFQNPRYDAVKTNRLLVRLRRLLGISLEEYEKGPAY